MGSFRFEDEAVTGDSARGGNRSHDGPDPPPFTAVEYIERYGERINGQRFSEMHLAGDVL